MRAKLGVMFCLEDANINDLAGTKQNKQNDLSSEDVYAKHGGEQIAKHASDALVSVRLVATWN